MEKNSRELISKHTDSVCDPTVSLDGMSVWDMLLMNKSKYKVVHSTYTERGKIHDIYKLHMNEYIGKEAFNKIYKCPLIGGVRGNNYQKNDKAFVIYDRPILIKLVSILGVKHE